MARTSNYALRLLEPQQKSSRQLPLQREAIIAGPQKWLPEQTA